MKGSVFRQRERGREGQRLCLILILLVWLAALKCLFNGVYYCGWNHHDPVTSIILSKCHTFGAWDEMANELGSIFFFFLPCPSHSFHSSTISARMHVHFGSGGRKNQIAERCFLWLCTLFIFTARLRRGVCCNQTAHSALLWKCDFIVSAITGLKAQVSVPGTCWRVCIERDWCLHCDYPTFLSASLNLPVLNTHTQHTYRYVLIDAVILD